MNEPTRFILIVDDNSTNLSILSQALKQVGLKVRMAMDGLSAINIAQQSPELILLDIQMPGIDGFETCARLKANPLTERIPIIFMTALNDTDSKVKGLSLGAVDYISKPFEEQEVVARVNVHLQLRHLTQALEEKTQQLNAKNLHLEETLYQLKSTQSQLIQSEKMSGLGQMVAGIAHEINNPIGFIFGNLTHAKEYVKNLLYLIQVYQLEYATPTPQIQKAIEEIDFDFLIVDLPKLLTSMQEGAERIRNIILSLRIFARLDEADTKAVDIHEGLDSSLLLLQHRLQEQKNRPAIAVKKEYGTIPLITCYASQMNQVFINIMNNAVDVLEEAKNHHSFFEPWIKISTQITDSNSVKIIIIDNGAGMTPEVQKNIFDPFFTTKPVGCGIGLGLSVSYQIVVKKHSGTINCVSSPLQGTEFTIEIPSCLQL